MISRYVCVNMNYLSLFISLIFLVGCSEHQHDESCGSHDGYHVHKPLLGGELIALGEHGSGYNLELLLDEKNLLSIYILDAHAENFVRIKQKSIRLVLSDENSTALTLHAVSDSATGETEGNTSHFQTKQSVKDHLPISGVIQEIKIGSKDFQETKVSLSGNS